MLKYILRRILLVIPTLFAILLVSFMISRSVPGDPVYMDVDAQFREGSNQPPEIREAAYRSSSHKLGLDQPLFYFGLGALSYPDTLHRILYLGDRENLTKMIHIYGNWPEISTYFHTIEAAANHCALTKVAPENQEVFQEVRVTLQELKRVSDPEEIQYRLGVLDSLRASHSFIDSLASSQLDLVKATFAEVQAQATPWKSYVPSFHLYGIHNQFHVWLTGLMRLDFGRSYVDRRPVRTIIAEAMPWTMFIGFFSFMASYLIAIPVGVYAVRKRNQWQDSVGTIVLFLVNSIPTFVMAMLAMTFLCNPDYLQIFPTSGVISDGGEQWSLGDRLLDHAYHLILPTAVFAYGGIAFVSRQMRGAMMENLQSDFIRTAWAKGLSENTVIWKHLLRNSLLPLVTMLAGLLPHIVAGGLIVERIFSVPGMGLITNQALFGFDHPVMIAALTITAIATVIGVLISDIVYAFVDPRISYT